MCFSNLDKSIRVDRPEIQTEHNQHSDANQRLFVIGAINEHLSLRYRVLPSAELVARLYRSAVASDDAASSASAALLRVLLSRKRVVDQLPKTLQWRSLYDALRAHLFASNHSLRRDLVTASVERFHALVALARVVRKLFAPSAIAEIVDELLPRFAPFDADVFVHQVLFAALVDASAKTDDYKLWLDRVFDVWREIDNSDVWDARWFWIVSLVAKTHCTVDWSSRVSFLFDVALRGANITLAG